MIPLVPGWKVDYDPPAVKVQQLLLQRFDQPLPDEDPKPICGEDCREIPDYGQLLRFLTAGITEDISDAQIYSCMWTFFMLEAKFRYLVVGGQPDKFRDEYLRLRHNIKRFMMRYICSSFFQSLSDSDREANAVASMMSRFVNDMGQFDRPDDELKTYPTNYTVGMRRFMKGGKRQPTLDELEEALPRRWDGRLRSHKKAEQEEEEMEVEVEVEGVGAGLRDSPVPRRPKEAVFAPQTQPGYRKPNFPRGKKRVVRVKVKPDGFAGTVTCPRPPPRERRLLSPAAKEAESSDVAEDLDEDGLDSSSESDADPDDIEHDSDDEDPDADWVPEPGPAVDMDDASSADDEMDVDSPARAEVALSHPAHVRDTPIHCASSSVAIDDNHDQRIQKLLSAIDDIRQGRKANRRDLPKIEDL